MKKNISQRDIAKMLNINVSTVSRALKGLPGVSPALRQDIMRLAERKGYRPDMSFSHNAHIVKWIEAEARKAGYMCIITDSGETYEGEVACVELLENLYVEGIIMGLSQETSDFSHLKRLKETHVPTVLFDRTSDLDFSSISINDVATAHQMTLHLIDGGARRIAFLGGANQMKQTSDRKHGYLEALRERGIPIRRELVKCNFASFNSGLTDTFDLFKLPEPPDAILAAHGLLTGSAFQAVLSLGFRIPEDVAICGYMSDWVSNMFHPRVTFVKQNLKEIGIKAFKLLHDQMNGDNSIRHIIVDARLEFRESTRNY